MLGLASGPSPALAAHIRRQFKQLAALVHPDKCAWAGAGEAFASLRAATDSLLEAAAQGEEPQGGSSGASGRYSKRRRTDSSGGMDAVDDSDGEGSWVPDGDGFPWWEEWDSPAREPQAAATGAAQAGAGGCAGGGEAAAAAQQQPAPDSVAGAASGAEEQQRVRCSSEEVEHERLAAMSVDELRAEVRRRQAALLTPPLDGTGRRLPLPQLQAALRRARTLLADRVAQETAATAAASGGGFL